MIESSDYGVSREAVGRHLDGCSDLRTRIETLLDTLIPTAEKEEFFAKLKDGGVYDELMHTYDSGAKVSPKALEEMAMRMIEERWKADESY